MSSALCHPLVAALLTGACIPPLGYPQRRAQQGAGPAMLRRCIDNVLGAAIMLLIQRRDLTTVLLWVFGRLELILAAEPSYPGFRTREPEGIDQAQTEGLPGDCGCCLQSIGQSHRLKQVGITGVLPQH
jgi:hypothetical protein